jgi:hypothetical protein
MAATNISTSTSIRPARTNEPELNMVDPLLLCHRANTD